MKSILVGADPEAFLFSQKDNKFVSSIGLIGGSKREPRPIGNGCAVQEDNVAVEFNIPPADSEQAFVDSLNFNLKYLEEHVKGMGLTLAIVPSAEFTEDQLDSPAAKEFGCEPDYCVWTKSVNPRPRATNTALRSAGGHIHVGFDKAEINFETVVKAMDVFVGCEMTVFDKDTKRRSLYGKPGAFRFKPYGVEYRTPSNAWLATDELKRWVYNQTMKAIAFAARNPEFNDDIAEKIQRCINESDESLLPEIRKFAEA